MDSLIIEKKVRLLVKQCLGELGRFCILVNFLADALHMLHQWKLESRMLALTWRLNHTCVLVYVALLIVGQIMAVLMMLLDQNRYIGVLILYIVIHLRIISNPTYWTLQLYLNACALISALHMAALQPRRHCCMIFLFMIYLTYQRPDHWLACLLQQVTVSFFVVCVMIGYHLRYSAIGLMLVIGIHNCFVNAWWSMPYSQTNAANMQRFQFWHTISMIGGLIMTAVHRSHRLSFERL